VSILALECWRTWREQRASAGLLAAGLTLIAVAMAFLPLGIDPTDPIYPQVMTAAGALLAALTLTEGLAGGGRRRANLEFLARMPTGLGRAFVTRLTFYLLGILFFALLGRSCALLFSGILEGGWERSLHGTGDRYLASIIPVVVMLTVVVATFGFAAALWVPQSALALPAGALAALVILAPLALFFFVPEILLVGPTPARVYEVVTLGGFAAALAAWQSFRLASRPERRTIRSVVRSSGLVALAVSPLWGWGVVCLARASAIDPADPNFRMLDVLVEPNGERAYLDGIRHPEDLMDLVGHIHRGKSFAMIADLKSGTWQSVDELPREELLAEFIAPVSYVDACQRLSSSLPTKPPEGPYGLALQERFGPPCTFLNGVGLSPELESLASASNNVLAGRVRGREGLGLSLMLVQSRLVYYDPFRRLACSRAELERALPNGERGKVWVRPGSWIVILYPLQRAIRFDPTTHSCSEPNGLVEHDVLVDIVSDGRCLVLRAGELFLVDPDTGSSTPIQFSDGLRDRIEGAWSRPSHESREGTSVLQIYATSWRGLARLEVGTNSLVRATGSDPLLTWFTVLAWPDSDHVIIEEREERIVKLRFGTNEREVLFPR
jgi:hypothetical protein